MKIEKYQMRVSLTRFILLRKETDEETNDLRTRQCMVRYVEAHFLMHPKRKAKQVVYRETKAR